MKPSTAPSTRRHRLALFLLFACCGMNFSAWLSRTPDVSRSLDADLGTMGLVLFGLSLGSITGLLSSGRLVSAWGTRTVLALSVAAMGSGLAAISLGAALGTAGPVFGGLLALGLGFGFCEVALNVDGAAIERSTDRSLLPALHGTWSVGTLLGAGAGAAASAAAIPPSLHLGLTAAATGALSAWAVTMVPRRSASPGPGSKAPAPSPPPRIWTDPRTVGIAVFVFGMAFVEGTANDWLPLALVTGYGLEPAAASASFTAFTAMMAAGRLLGGPVVDRLGRTLVLQGSAAAAAAGILLFSADAGPLLGVAGIVLWGAGAALGFPLGIAAAADVAAGSESRVSAVATAGYLAFLAGPPLLGTLGQHVGILQAFLAAAALALVAFALARASKPVGQPSGRTEQELQPSRH